MAAQLVPFQRSARVRSGAEELAVGFANPTAHISLGFKATLLTSSLATLAFGLVPALNSGLHDGPVLGAFGLLAADPLLPKARAISLRRRSSATVRLGPGLTFTLPAAGMPCVVALATKASANPISAGAMRLRACVRNESSTKAFPPLGMETQQVYATRRPGAMANRSKGDVMPSCLLANEQRRW